MKYRELTPNEIEAYNIGYKNGSRQAIIKVLEYETPEEKMFYRQGYNAGCQDRKRHNVKTCEIGSNVSNVSNVKSYDSGVSCESCDSTITNNNTITNTIVDSKESIGGVGGKREKANETSVFHVDCQNFDEIPPDILPVMKKYWTDEKIEKIRQDLAFMPSHDSCVATLLTKYDSDLLKHEEPKPKKKSYGEQQKVKLSDEEYTKLQVLYGNRLDLGIQKLDTYLAQSIKNEKKYTNHYAVMRRNNWVYNETFKEDYLPPEPEIADKSKFVRAKPL